MNRRTNRANPVSPNKIPQKNIGKVAVKAGGKQVPPTQSMQKRLDPPTEVKALQELNVHYKQ